jgi:hypothetical protein
LEDFILSLLHYFFDLRSFFGANENFKISFRDLLAGSLQFKAALGFGWKPPQNPYY